MYAIQRLMLYFLALWTVSTAQVIPAPSGGGPTGAAGGVLAGAYPNPALATQAANTVLCNGTSSTAAPTACTASTLASSLGMVVASAMTPGAIPQTGKWTVANSGANFLITNPDGTTSTIAKAAAVTQSVTVFALPANSVLLSCLAKSSTAFTGTTALTATAGVTGSLTACVSTPYDLKAAVSASNLSVPIAVIPTVTIAGTNVVLALTSTIDNVSSIATGSISIWLTWYQLPQTP